MAPPCLKRITRSSCSAVLFTAWGLLASGYFDDASMMVFDGLVLSGKLKTKMLADQKVSKKVKANLLQGEFSTRPAMYEYYVKHKLFATMPYHERHQLITKATKIDQKLFNEHLYAQARSDGCSNGRGASAGQPHQLSIAFFRAFLEHERP